MHVLHNFWVFDINTTAFRLGQYSLHLLLLQSSMAEQSKAISNLAMTHNEGKISNQKLNK